MSKITSIPDVDLTGRVMALEQRLRGLQGRVSAIEARLSPGDGPVPNGPCVSGDDLGVDFVPAMAQPDLPAKRTENMAEAATTGRLSLREVDLTGLIAGAVLIGTGLILYAGNVDLIKNPLVATGCGILLMASALRRLVT